MFILWIFIKFAFRTIISIVFHFVCFMKQRKIDKKRRVVL